MSVIATADCVLHCTRHYRHPTSSKTLHLGSINRIVLKDFVRLTVDTMITTMSINSPQVTVVKIITAKVFSYAPSKKNKTVTKIQQYISIITV